MFGVILHFFMVVWWVKKKSSIIPRHKTDQHQLRTFKKKVMIIEDISCPGPIVSYGATDMVLVT